MTLIRDMQHEDLAEVVVIHQASFVGFFLSFMGHSFLKAFYKTMLLDRLTIALVAERNRRVIGFVVGTIHPNGLYKRVLLKDWSRFLPTAIIPILKKPYTALQLLRRLFTIQKARYQQNEALLMSIAVLPSKQGQGIGQQLIATFLSAARKRGASSVSLTTDKLGNGPVNRFYLQSGFKCRNSFTTPEGREMNEYCLALS